MPDSLETTLNKLKDKLFAVETLPQLPVNTLDWIQEARPNVGGKERDFRLEPFWIDVYEDNHPQVMVVNGRQTFKTTFCSDRIANYATSHPNVEVCYVADNESHLSAFSKQRLRRGTFLDNPLLRTFLPHGRANVGEIALKNNSIVYLRTDESEYLHVEGLSNYLLVLDEAQYQDLQFVSRATYSLTITHGQFFVLGIGGEAGSEYHKMWTASDQREWVYKDKDWRDKLKFDAHGMITNDQKELANILDGRWIPLRPEHTTIRGYHMPQSIFARIPLTIDDAINRYHIAARNSIEWQKKHNPPSIFSSHCTGQFYKAERRPVTPEMVQACMSQEYTLLTPPEISELKHTFGSAIRVIMGVDFGSGASGASSTVVSILIHWRKTGRYQLVFLNRRPQEHGLDQARYISEIGSSAGIDIGVGDLGYGQDRVKVIQDGGRDSKDNRYRGLGRRRFVGCRTIGDESKPQLEFKQDTDEHGTQLGRLQIDKTTTIQKFIDFIGWYVAHPAHPDDEKLKRTKLLIPSGNDWETDFLVDDFCSITRKDLEENPDEVVEDPRQRARKEFNHPPDTVMSIIYCLVGDENYDEGAFRIA